METLPSSSQTSSTGALSKELDDKEKSLPGVESRQISSDLAGRLDKYSLEDIVELKISRFLDQIGTYYPEDLHSLIMKKVEKPLIGQILRRTGGKPGPRIKNPRNQPQHPPQKDEDLRVRAIALAHCRPSFNG